MDSSTRFIQSAWLRQNLHSQIERLTRESDRLTREALGRRLSERMSVPGQIDSQRKVVPPPLAADQLQRTEQYLQLLACCGGPFIHGEAISAFEFLVFVELIPDEAFWEIRGEEELSCWLDRVRVLSRCGYIEPESVDLARAKVQHLLRRRLVGNDRDSQLWLAAFTYFAERSNVPCEMLIECAADY